MHLPPFLLRVLRLLGSLRLTVWLLALAIVMVFFGTLDQVRIGIREAQSVYFESLLAFWTYPPEWPLGGILSHIPLPVPGGYLIGPLLAVNLVISHFMHFKISWRLAGISVIHLGVLMLLVGQLMTNLLQEESYMWLDEGERANYITSFHEDELYLVRTTGEGRKGVFSFPFSELESGQVIDPQAFPFRVRIREVFRNAEIQSVGRAPNLNRYGVNRGIGQQFQLGVTPIASFRSDNQRDVRTAVVEILHEDRTEGVWLVSNVFEERFPEQEFEIGGESYTVGLRFKKTYLPFAITLLDFEHERYPGTNIPSNFSSHVQVEDLRTGDEQETTIYMNNPLRYEGLTFYQASFAKQDTASMFQVVRNPGWLMPYIACTLVSLGLLYQFIWFAVRSMRRSRK
jgi:hypothetical protein